MNKTSMEITLPIRTAARDSAGLIPNVKAEKTVIASPTPRFPGVTATSKLRFPIAERNRAEANEISVPNVEN